MARKQPLYLTVLKEAWQFTWHHPVLWLLGFFAMAVGHTGVLEIVGGVADKIDNSFVNSLVPVQPATALVIPTVFGSRLLGTLGNGLVAIAYLGLGILIVIAAIGSTGALIHATKRFKKAKTEHVRTAWHHGIDRFWPLLWLNLGKKLILALLIWLLGIPLVALLSNTTGTAAMVGFILLFVLTILLGLFVSFLVNYASMYVVIEEEHLGRSLHDAWRLFREHWLVSIEMALILLLIQVGVYFLALAGFAVVFLPFMAFWVASVVLSMSVLVVIGGVISYTLGIVFVLWLISCFSTYSISAWTILYTHLRSPRSKVQSAVHRVLSVALNR